MPTRSKRRAVHTTVGYCLVAAAVIFAFEGGLFGFDHMFGRRPNNKAIEFLHRAGDPGRNSARACALTAAAAEVIDRRFYEHERYDDEHHDGHSDPENCLQKHHGRALYDRLPVS